MKIRGTCLNCGRDFLTQQVLDSGGHCWNCHKPYQPHYTAQLAESLEQNVEEGFNRYWGLLFKEGNENSRFGSQVEQYACLYTSRVSNFLYLSPMQYLRAQRDRMPHEMAWAPTGRMAPVGSEGPPKGARRG